MQPSLALSVLLDEAKELLPDVKAWHAFLETTDVLHLSLTKPLYIQTAQRRQLREAVDRIAKGTERCAPYFAMRPG